MLKRAVCTAPLSAGQVWALQEASKQCPAWRLPGSNQERRPLFQGGELSIIPRCDWWTVKGI